jgi:hypothetical protein
MLKQKLYPHLTRFHLLLKLLSLLLSQLQLLRKMKMMMKRNSFLLLSQLALPKKL